MSMETIVSSSTRSQKSLKEIEIDRVAKPNRGPLRAIILSETGQDVRACGSCWQCDDERHPGMDLCFGELMRAAANDDPTVLLNETLWNCDPILDGGFNCQSGIQLQAVINVLRREAKLRGVPRRHS
jgi:heterodisulfide reductase subunit C